MTRPLVLVVDDDDLMLEVFDAFLQSLGYATRTGALGMTGLRLAAETPPALALVDVRLPDMSGYDVCKSLTRQHIPVLLTSAYTDEEVEQAAHKAGAVGVLPKNVAADVLGAVIARHVGPR